MKQTAVEWLIELLAKEKIAIPDYIINKAKEMEKQQIFDAYREFIDFSLSDKVCDEYYNETFNKGQ